MNTATHAVVAATLLARRRAPVRNVAVLAGALVADLSMFVFYGWAKLLTPMTEREIWTEAYWREPWQVLGAISNSVPLALAVLAIARWRGSVLSAVLAAAWLSHLALDFPVHATDAHRHFWPLTDWRFESPLSYWDSRYGAAYVGVAEVTLFLLCTVALWRRFDGRWTRPALMINASAFVGVYLYFALIL